MKKLIFILATFLMSTISEANFSTDFDLDYPVDNDTDFGQQGSAVDDLKDLMREHCLQVDPVTNEIIFNENCDSILEDLIDDREIMAGGSVCWPSGR